MRRRGFDQAGRARFRAAVHRHAPPHLDRKEHASVILHALRRAQRYTMECALRLARCPFDCGLANYAGGSCRVFEHVDGDAVCAAGAGGEVVLCKDARERNRTVKQRNQA